MGDNTMQELENLLNKDESYAGRLAEFLKHKTAPKPQNKQPFLLNGFDISIDLDVDLVKLPPKPTLQKAPKADETKKQSLHKTTKNDSVSNSIDSAKQQATAAGSPQRSPSLSPRKSLRRSLSVCGSDRLRRAAISRRSKSLNRRDLMKDFENTIVTSSFLPAVSSTPVVTNKLENQQTTKHVQQNRQEPDQLDNAAAPPLPALTGPQLGQFNSNFIANLTQLNEPGDMPIRSSTTAKRASSLTLGRSNNAEVSEGKRLTFTVEAGPEPGQLLLSPSSKNKSCNFMQRTSQPLSPLRHTSPRQSMLNQIQVSEGLNLSAKKRDVVVPDTPPRLIPQSQPNPQVIVPESPLQRDQNLQTAMQNLASNATCAPFMVVPMACISPKPITQLEAAPPAVAAVEKNKSVASRSMQTSCGPQFVENIKEIMTDDESNNENENSTSPLNLAPSGSNSTRRRLRKRRPRAESPFELLDLHRSRSKTSQGRITRQNRRTALNKPSSRPINGEEFAAELARMSNYEILDLRQRNSLGLLHPLNGQRRSTRVQKELLEEHIEQEMLRRNLSTKDDVQSSSNHSAAVPTTPPSVKTTAITVEQSVDKELETPVLSRSRLKKQQSGQSLQYQKRNLQPEYNDITVNESLSTFPAAPPENFKDSLVQEQICIPQVESTSHVAPTPLQVNPVNSSMPGQLSLQYQKTLARQQRSLEMRLQNNALPVVVSDDFTVNSALPIEPPPNFSSPQKQLSTPKTRKSKNMETVENVENELLVVCTPPAEFNCSKSGAVQEEPTVELTPAIIQDDQTETNADNEIQEIAPQPQSPTQNDNNELQISSHMEDKQIETPKSLSPQEKSEQPSTSKGAVKKNNQRSKKEIPENSKEINPDSNIEEEATNCFKKPSAPAPRTKRTKKSKLECQLAKIRVGKHDTHIEMDESESNTSGTRKSKRGHVPLQNTWAHTMSDPFAFMRKKEESSMKPTANKSSSKKMKAEESAISIMNRPPLHSSTPHNTDATERQKNNEIAATDETGFESRTNITEQMEQQNNQPAKNETRGRKKKIDQVHHSQIGKESEHSAEASANAESKKKVPKKNGKKKKTDENKSESASFTATAEPECSVSASQNTNQSSFKSGQPNTLIAFLRGESIAALQNNTDTDLQTDKVIISRTNNLIFTTVDGVDYAFYTTGIPYTLGYIRLKPLQSRGFKRVKNQTLIFTTFEGEIVLETTMPGSDIINQYTLYPGDTAEVKNGIRYNIRNRLDNISITTVYRQN